MTPLLFALPWVGILAYVVFVVRLPSELPGPTPAREGEAPFVSVIVPARDEAVNIEACVRSLTSSTYPTFEVIVVDDGSEDGTGGLARGVGPGRARRLEVIEGTPLPPGWLGKPWACQQGFEVAEGELLLFTDADTTHGPGLLGRAVAGLEEDGADLLTVVGRQLLGSFWERLVQPQIFFMMFFRFPRVEQAVKNHRWRDALANGQYMLFRRETYLAIGGHEAVRDEIVEDLALAQHVKRAGLQLRVRSAETELATRMYRSLRQLVDGWSKNIVLGGLQSLPGWVRPFAPPLALATGVALWIAPPAALVLALAGAESDGLLTWSATVYGTSVLLWALVTRQMGAPWHYGVLYPLGALVGAYIFARSWARGRHVAWKGRRYDVPPASARP
jgi:chlorobactene glucosyltransferase